MLIAPLAYFCLTSRVKSGSVLLYIVLKKPIRLSNSAIVNPSYLFDVKALIFLFNLDTKENRRKVQRCV